MKKRFLKQKAFFQIFIIIFAIFAIYSAKPVSALEACCEKTLSGEFCQYTNADNCNQNYNAAATTCGKTNYCSTGCCITEEGCSYNTGKASCESARGTFNEGLSCNSIAECIPGCCVLDSQCSYVTENTCNNIFSQYPDKEMDFRNIISEEVCLDICLQQNLGCCVSLDGICSYTKRDNCPNPQINYQEKTGFFQQTICSTIDTCSNCQPQHHKGCYKDDVYWFDSCNNPEFIAQDCDLTFGTKCVEENNIAFCKNLDCEETYVDFRNIHDPGLGDLKEYGESWCLYESGTGNYLDRPGSRHYRVACIDGEEIIEPCRDFREEVCIQSEKDDFTQSQCISINIYDSPVNSQVATVSPGTRFWEAGSPNFFSRSARNIENLQKANSLTEGGDGSLCNVASLKCPVLYVRKNRASKWKCEKNCECITQDWVDKAAEYCKAQGDCGADLDLRGYRSKEGFIVKGHDPPKPNNGIRKVPLYVSNRAWQEWSRFGVYGNIKDLAEEIIKEIPSPKEFKTQEIIIPIGYGIALSLASTALSIIYADFIIASKLYSLTFLGLSKIAIIKSALGAVGLLGPLVLIGATIAAATTYFLTGGETKIEYVEVTCNSWQAQPGGGYCHLCDLNFKSCSEYKCKSLGQACQYISENEGTDRASCYNAHPNDANAPKISPAYENLTQGYNIIELSNGYEIKPDIMPYTRITFGIETDEPAQCKFSLEPSISYESMINYFGDSYYDSNHYTSALLPEGQSYSYYVKCQDPAGNQNQKDYVIKFTIDQGPDRTPPKIEATSINNEGFVPHNTTSTPLTIFVNEPARCKWALENTAFDQMPNEFLCDTTPDTTFLNLYDCYTLLNITKKENNFYFRCRDYYNNANENSYPFTLYLSDQLQINSKKPQDIVNYNEINLELTTSGGAENGKAICSFKQNNQDIEFFQTNNNIHIQPLVLSYGSYNYPITCIDSSSNIATDTIQFSVAADTSLPQIEYIYKSLSTLFIGLNEDTICEYSKNPFTFGNGNLMTGENKQHTLQIASNKYFIICKDNFNNQIQFKVYS